MDIKSIQSEDNEEIIFYQNNLTDYQKPSNEIYIQENKKILETDNFFPDERGMERILTKKRIDSKQSNDELNDTNITLNMKKEVINNEDDCDKSTKKNEYMITLTNKFTLPSESPKKKVIGKNNKTIFNFRKTSYDLDDEYHSEILKGNNRIFNTLRNDPNKINENKYENGLMLKKDMKKSHVKKDEKGPSLTLQNKLTKTAFKKINIEPLTCKNNLSKSYKFTSKIKFPQFEKEILDKNKNGTNESISNGKNFNNQKNGCLHSQRFVSKDQYKIFKSEARGNKKQDRLEKSEENKKNKKELYNKRNFFTSKKLNKYDAEMKKKDFSRLDSKLLTPKRNNKIISFAEENTSKNSSIKLQNISSFNKNSDKKVLRKFETAKKINVMNQSDSFKETNTVEKIYTLKKFQTVKRFDGKKFKLNSKFDVKQKLITNNEISNLSLDHAKEIIVDNPKFQHEDDKSSKYPNQKIKIEKKKSLKTTIENKKIDTKFSSPKIKETRFLLNVEKNNQIKYKTEKYNTNFELKRPENTLFLEDTNLYKSYNEINNNTMNSFLFFSELKENFILCEKNFYNFPEEENRIISENKNFGNLQIKQEKLETLEKQNLFYKEYFSLVSCYYKLLLHRSDEDKKNSQQTQIKNNNYKHIAHFENLNNLNNQLNKLTNEYENLKIDYEKMLLEEDEIYYETINEFNFNDKIHEKNFDINHLVDIDNLLIFDDEFLKDLENLDEQYMYPVNNTVKLIEEFNCLNINKERKNLELVELNNINITDIQQKLTKLQDNFPLYEYEIGIKSNYNKQKSMRTIKREEIFEKKILYGLMKSFPKFEYFNKFDNIIGFDKSIKKGDLLGCLNKKHKSEGHLNEFFNENDLNFMKAEFNESENENSKNNINCNISTKMSCGNIPLDNSNEFKDIKHNFLIHNSHSMKNFLNDNCKLLEFDSYNTHLRNSFSALNFKSNDVKKLFSEDDFEIQYGTNINPIYFKSLKRSKKSNLKINLLNFQRNEINDQIEYKDNCIDNHIFFGDLSDKTKNCEKIISDSDSNEELDVVFVNPEDENEINFSICNNEKYNLDFKNELCDHDKTDEEIKEISDSNNPDNMVKLFRLIKKNISSGDLEKFLNPSKIKSQSTYNILNNQDNNNNLTNNKSYYNIASKNFVQNGIKKFEAINSIKYHLNYKSEEQNYLEYDKEYIDYLNEYNTNEAEDLESDFYMFQ